MQRATQAITPQASLAKSAGKSPRPTMRGPTVLGEEPSHTRATASESRTRAAFNLGTIGIVPPPPTDLATPSQSPSTSGLLQRKCACGASSSGGDCSECTEKKRGELQRKASGAAESAASTVPASVHRVLESSGQPMAAPLRHDMDTMFKHDFSQVRIHTDAQANASARAVGAQAYTVGHHVAFASGAYQPNDRGGRGVLAHELTHVVQQSGSSASLSPLTIGSPTSSAEQEAEQVRAAVDSGNALPPVRQHAGAGLHRLPGSPAGGCGLCFDNLGDVGTMAHTLIEGAFHRERPQVDTEISLHLPGMLPSPTDDNGRLDLGMFNMEHDTVIIGEIKPANLGGVFGGDRDLLWYSGELEKQGLHTQRLTIPPPFAPIPFPTMAPKGCPQQQELRVNPPILGVYTYSCIPDFKELVAECDCEDGPRDRIPKPFPKTDEVKEKEDKKVDDKDKDKVKDDDKEKDKGKDKEKDKDKGKDKDKPIFGDPEPIPIPIAARDLALLALMAAAMAWMGKRMAGRAAAPAMVLAAIVLISNGAEASIGLSGDDYIDALCKLSAQKGAPVPDDVRDAIKKDPALRKIMEDASKSGNTNAAQQALGNELTRVIEANRDQFTDEELKELLKVTDENSTVIPNGKITVEALKKSLEARQKAAPGAGADKKDDSGDKKGPDDAPPTQTGDTGPPLPAPAQRLFDAVTKGSTGPKPTPADLQRLRAIIAAANPPLSDDDVTALMQQLQATEGKTIDEILASIQNALAKRKGAGTGDGQDGGKPTDPAADKDKKAADGGDTKKTDDAKKAPDSDAAKTPDPAKSDKPGAAATQDAVSKAPDPKGKPDQKLADVLEKKFGGTPAGETDIYPTNKDLVFVDGQSFTGFIVGRDDKSLMLFAGSGSVTARRSGSDWMLEVSAGIELRTARGVFGTTKKFTVKAIPGAGQGPPKPP
ncbi:DUF4157 domain-containing protein [Dyella silvatica]|uniref:eCIS core domain-containing protein n=1 Tax=Dyella silvatica TaxID=2992128 RepID=UPI002254D3AC|nr:DUF4157 domain-containing protein [Dyella silvatica]